ncbi:MAG: long-chain N-acyl amino acid synthase [Pseudomonadota bacterium]
MSNTDNPADHWKQTIIGLPLDSPLRPLSLDHPEQIDAHNISLDQQQFKIRLANSEGRRESATLLIKKMYAWRGYDAAGMGDNPNRITLMADAGGIAIGTITIGLDSPAGLLVDGIYRDEVDRLRAQGCAVCEYTKLAVDQEIRSKRVLASLFHLATIYAHRIHHATDAVIEVNPRHVPFYHRMLGFEPLGEERMCPRANAPAILLHLRYDYLDEQVAKYGGAMRDLPGVRSFYPFFFSKRDEDGITQRLLQDD